MSISDTLRRAGPYSTNGSQTAFPFAFKVFEEDHVAVTKITGSTVEDLDFGIDFTVSLNANQDTTPGGVVVISPALSSGSTITIISEAPYEQPTQFSNQGGFYPSVLNDALDRATIQIQQIIEKLTRGLFTPSGVTASALNGLFLTVAAGAVSGMTPAQAAALVNPYISGVKGDKGDPGGSAMAVGLGTEIASLSIPAGTDMIQTNGYAARGDYGAARYIAIDEPDADWGWMRLRDRWMIETANGRWFMLDPSQSIRPEMFGAVGDAEHYPGDLTRSVYYSDDWTIWKSDVYTGPNGTGSPTDDWEPIRAVTDYATWLGGGLWIENRPGAIYAFSEPRKSVGGANTKYQVKRRDGRLVEMIEDYDDGIATDDPKWNPYLSGVRGLRWNFNGSRWVQMPYHIPEEGHATSGDIGDPRWHARGLGMYKCEGIRFDGFELDMNWRKHTSWSGRGFQRNDWGLKIGACKNLVFDHGRIHDSPHDGIYLFHRFLSGVGGMAPPLDPDLTNTPTEDGDWTGDVPVPDLYWPHGENHRIIFRDFHISNCARQGISAIGGREIYYINGSINGTQQYLGTAPINTVGAANHGLDDWRLPRLAPGCALDAEPNREHPRSVEDFVFLGTKFRDNFSIVGATGQGDFTRVFYTFTSSEVNAATNTVTITGNLLPDAILLQRVRVDSDGTLPAGLQKYRNYWLKKSEDGDSFTFHLARQDGIDGVNPVDITDAGTGTHHIAVYRAKSQVHNVRLIDCDMDHPANGGDPFPGEATRVFVHGGTFFNRSRTRAIGDNGTYQAEFDWRGVHIVAYAASHNSDDTTNSEIVTADAAADTINGTALRLDRFRFAKVRFYSTADLPAPLVANTDYWATYITDDQCKLSVSPEAARAGTYIDITTAGSGTITMIQQSSEWSLRNSSITYTVPEGFEFDAALDVDEANDTINFPDAHQFGNRGEDRCQFRPYSGSTLPGGLVAGTTYYPVAVDETRIIVCASGADASANPPVPISLTAGSGWCKSASTGQRAILINQRGVWNNVDIFFDRRNYPTGASSFDGIVFRQCGEVSDLRFRTDMLPADGIVYVKFDNCAEIGKMSYPANGTIQPEGSANTNNAFNPVENEHGVVWATTGNKTWNPRTDGVFGLYNIALDANYTVTLSATGVREGQTVTISRSGNATGAFNLTVEGVALANAGEFAVFRRISGAWVMVRRG